MQRESAHADVHSEASEPTRHETPLSLAQGDTRDARIADLERALNRIAIWPGEGPQNTAIRAFARRTLERRVT